MKSLKPISTGVKPALTVSIDEFRLWMKVPEDAYPNWIDLKRNVVLPAVNEINQHSEDGGFDVTYEGIRNGKPFTKIKIHANQDKIARQSR